MAEEGKARSRERPRGGIRYEAEVLKALSADTDGFGKARPYLVRWSWQCFRRWQRKSLYDFCHFAVHRAGAGAGHCSASE
jgi:hypothetical protein